MHQLTQFIHFRKFYVTGPLLLRSLRSRRHSSAWYGGGGLILNKSVPTELDVYSNKNCTTIIVNYCVFAFGVFIFIRRLLLPEVIVDYDFLYSAQCKRRSGENNRTLTLTLFLTLNLTLNDYFRHCAICIAPNTDSLNYCFFLECSLAKK